MLYFKGCTTRERINSISNFTEQLLKLAKIDFKTLDNEKCCGSVLIRTGFTDEAREHMEKNISMFKDEKILVSCAGCYKTLKKDYTNLLKVKLEVIHISQLLRDLIRENKLCFLEKSSNNVDINIINNNNLLDNVDISDYNDIIDDNDIIDKNNDTEEFVTYHDPCHLGRHMEEFDAPREVIQNFSKLKEMENIREKSRCCGSGGGVKSAFPKISKSISIERIKEAEKFGNNILITSCPFCKLNLQKNSSLEVLDLSEFVFKQVEKEFEKNEKKLEKDI